MENFIWEKQFLHGCDYNPDQWLDRPDILAADITLMKKSNINCVSLGIFAWAKLEPREGEYDFEWIARIIDDLYNNGIYTILATPSGARPMWMAHKYPEVLRVESNLIRIRPGGRHNHCYTSPVYRQKVWDINVKLSERFGKHPGVILWHISNEYGGECYCELCQSRFRLWLQDKYKTLDALNGQWWTAFWSQTYTDWNQIIAPSGNNDENAVHGLTLDWKRFVTYQTANFLLWEKQAIRTGGSDLPVTTNFMFLYNGLNYFKFKDLIDVISWDNYPIWHKNEDDVEKAVLAAYAHDLMRSIQKKPFLLMESTPSATNWQPVSKIKRPGMHMLSSIQAIAHGANSVQYFQWRSGRGGFEKFHGSVIGHSGTDDTRVFNDVRQVGERLNGLSDMADTRNIAKVAILFDWENKWAIESAKGPRNAGMHYVETVLSHYQPFWQLGINVDILDMECGFSPYRLLIAPMLYLQRAGVAEKLRGFVKDGGILVGTYWSGVVNENDLCFQNQPPNELTEVFGIKVDEIDALYENQFNEMQWHEKTYKITELCERIHTSGAKTLSVYEKDFYSGESVFTVNSFGKGAAYYIAAKAENIFYFDFYKEIIRLLDLDTNEVLDLPYGVTCNTRYVDDSAFLILQNFLQAEVNVPLCEALSDFETGYIFADNIPLNPYEVKLLEKNKNSQAFEL